MAEKGTFLFSVDMLDKQAMLDQLHSINPKATFDPIEGNLRSSYQINGRVSGSLSGYKVTGMLHLNSGTVPMTVAISGQGSGRWSTDKGMLYTCAERESSSISREIVWPHGEVESGPVSLPGAVQGMVFPYVCTGSELVLQLPGGRMQQRYTRVRE